jgi:hypothetical protein
MYKSLVVVASDSFREIYPNTSGNRMVIAMQFLSDGVKGS